MGMNTEYKALDHNQAYIQAFDETRIADMFGANDTADTVHCGLKVFSNNEFLILKLLSC
jgi:hypothetical protein